jgi:hypothetical protein
VGDNIGLVGPGMYVLVLLVLLDAVAAAFLVLDAWRRPATDIVPQAAYVALYVIAQVPFLTALMPWSNVYPLLAPLVFVEQLAYLLRVVFPTHGRLEARLEARFLALSDTGVMDPEDDPAIARSTTNA